MKNRCEDCKHSGRRGWELPCTLSLDSRGGKPMFERKAMTNADRIRSMTDEELAEFLHAFDSCKYCNRTEDECCTSNDCDTHSVKVMLEWLQKDSEV